MFLRRILALMVLGIVQVHAAEPTTRPVPLPPPARLQLANRQVDEICRQPARRHDAASLLSLARQTPEDPALRYALIRRALQQAADAPRLALALECMGELARQFDLNELELREQFTVDLKKAGHTSAAATLAMRSLELSLLHADFPHAARFAGHLQSCREGGFEDRIAEQLADYQYALKCLAGASPDSTQPPPLFACLYQNRWSDNLSQLSSAGTSWSVLAQADLAANSLSSRLDAADAWWNAGRAHGGRTGWRIAARACEIYRQLAGKLSGAHLELAMARLDQYERQALLWHGLSPGVVREVWRSSSPDGGAISACDVPAIDREQTTGDIPKTNGHVRFRGQLHITLAGVYEFTFSAGTALRVVLDGKTLIDNPTAYRRRSGEQLTLDLKPGLHPFEIEVWSKSSPPRLALTWLTPLSPQPAPIPPSAFYHDAIELLPPPAADGK